MQFQEGVLKPLRGRVYKPEGFARIITDAIAEQYGIISTEEERLQEVSRNIDKWREKNILPQTVPLLKPDESLFQFAARRHFERQ